MKTELRDILTPVGIWSDAFSQWIDKNLIDLSLLGKPIESIGKWIKRKDNPHNKEELERYRQDTKSSLVRNGAWSQEFEAWLNNGSPKDLMKVGENMDYMGRVCVNLLM